LLPATTPSVNRGDELSPSGQNQPLRAKLLPSGAKESRATGRFSVTRHVTFAAEGLPSTPTHRFRASAKQKFGSAKQNLGAAKQNSGAVNQRFAMAGQRFAPANERFAPPKQSFAAAERGLVPGQQGVGTREHRRAARRRRRLSLRRCPPYSPGRSARELPRRSVIRRRTSFLREAKGNAKNGCGGTGWRGRPRRVILGIALAPAMKTFVTQFLREAVVLSEQGAHRASSSRVVGGNGVADHRSLVLGSAGDE
jgi:hypothetical protein